MTYTITPDLAKALVEEFGFKHNKGDNTLTRALSEHFSLEVSPTLELHLICDCEESLTGTECFELGTGYTIVFHTISSILVEEKLRQAEAMYRNNIEALLKINR
jgi:hypothetical protein